MLLSITLCQAQEEKSYAEQLLELEDELDSLSIFNLLDSVLLLGSTSVSEFNVRYGFTSSVTSGGRDYSIDQKGYSIGASYFHKTGLYADLTGFWNSNVTPNYNPTILSVGYLGSFSRKWSYSFDYEHIFYNPNDTSKNPLTQSFGTSISYDFKIGYISLDYSHLFGEVQADRFIGNLAGTINLGKWWIFDDSRLFPTVSLLIGNGNVTSLRITREQATDQFKFSVNTFNQLTGLTDEQRERLKRFILLNPDIARERKTRLISVIELFEEVNPTEEELEQLNSIAINGFEEEEFVDGEEFGPLNYSISIPLSLTIGKCSILLSYTYSIPVKLPNEFFDVEPIGYFGASILYRIPLK